MRVSSVQVSTVVDLSDESELTGPWRLVTRKAVAGFLNRGRGSLAR